MGYATPDNLKGNFFLKINDESPYGLNATKDFKPICHDNNDQNDDSSNNDQNDDDNNDNIYNNSNNQ